MRLPEPAKRTDNLGAAQRTIRRVATAAMLVGVAGSLALLTSCGGGHADRPVIGVVQVSSLAALDEAREGFYKALADSGYIRDVTVTFLERNAQGDIPTLSLIMREFLQQGVTHVATMSSVATQTAMKVITDRPIVFGAVANPYVINAGTSPTSHRPNVTGAEIPLPVDSALALGHSTFPKAVVWGTLFDPADPFAEHYLGVVKRKAEQLGIRFVTVACTSPQDIASGVQALRAQGVGGIMQISEHHDRWRLPGAHQAGPRARHAGGHLQHGISRRTAVHGRELLRQRLRARAADDPRTARREPRGDPVPDVGQSAPGRRSGGRRRLRRDDPSGRSSPARRR